MFELKTIALFCVTAVAEIVGCYLAYLWIRQDKSALLLVPAALSLALFAWLLSLHPSAAGRVYAAYGGVYIGVSILSGNSVNTFFFVRFKMNGST